jgi:hypothetical protein
MQKTQPFSVMSPFLVTSRAIVRSGDIAEHWPGLTVPRLARQNRRQIPHVWLVGREPQKDAGLRSFGSEAVAVGRTEVAPGDGGADGFDVALDELGTSANLDSAEWSSRLEHDEDAPRVARQVTKLHVALGNDDLERVVGPAKPDR